ncbi:Elongator complex protein 2 [Fragariocoptes setiger]|uniref:Elongator complex protein 2 n=1 Tax=Fragariocoptes setiger TaxID=1670756 RepID=A0ABQ7SCL1_9ACAR|nr:Elongator complex protein 2 [Fragariocoptes setiger]
MATLAIVKLPSAGGPNNEPDSGTSSPSSAAGDAVGGSATSHAPLMSSDERDKQAPAAMIQAMTPHARIQPLTRSSARGGLNQGLNHDRESIRILCRNSTPVQPDNSNNSDHTSTSTTINDNNNDSDEFAYGPGIVDRLRAKFMTISSQTLAQQLPQSQLQLQHYAQQQSSPQPSHANSVSARGRITRPLNRGAFKQRFSASVDCLAQRHSTTAVVAINSQHANNNNNSNDSQVRTMRPGIVTNAASHFCLLAAADNCSLTNSSTTTTTTTTGVAANSNNKSQQQMQQRHQLVKPIIIKPQLLTTGSDELPTGEGFVRTRKMLFEAAHAAGSGMATRNTTSTTITSQAVVCNRVGSVTNIHRQYSSEEHRAQTTATAVLPKERTLSAPQAVSAETALRAASNETPAPNVRLKPPISQKPIAPTKRIDSGASFSNLSQTKSTPLMATNCNNNHSENNESELNVDATSTTVPSYYECCDSGRVSTTECGTTPVAPSIQRPPVPARPTTIVSTHTSTGGGAAAAACDSSPVPVVAAKRPSVGLNQSNSVSSHTKDHHNDNDNDNDSDSNNNFNNTDNDNRATGTNERQATEKNSVPSSNEEKSSHTAQENTKKLKLTRDTRYRASSDDNQQNVATTSSEHAELIIERLANDADQHDNLCDVDNVSHDRSATINQSVETINQANDHSTNNDDNTCTSPVKNRPQVILTTTALTTSTTNEMDACNLISSTGSILTLNTVTNDEVTQTLINLSNNNNNHRNNNSQDNIRTTGILKDITQIIGNERSITTSTISKEDTDSSTTKGSTSLNGSSNKNHTPTTASTEISKRKQATGNTTSELGSITLSARHIAQQQMSLSSTTLVFDFRNRNDVKPNVAVRPRCFVSSGDADCVNGGSQSTTGAQQQAQTAAPLVLEFIFEGDNVIVGNGSLLVRRNKQLKLKFDDANTSTFEYPSEACMLRHLEESLQSLPQRKNDDDNLNTNNDLYLIRAQNTTSSDKTLITTTNNSDGLQQQQQCDTNQQILRNAPTINNGTSIINNKHLSSYRPSASMANLDSFDARFGVKAMSIKSCPVTTKTVDSNSTSNNNNNNNSGHHLSNGNGQLKKADGIENEEPPTCQYCAIVYNGKLVVHENTLSTSIRLNHDAFVVKFFTFAAYCFVFASVGDDSYGNVVAMQINQLIHELEYAAVSANRSLNSCLDCTSRLVAFGAGRYVALFDRQQKRIIRLLLAHKDLVSCVRFIEHLVPEHEKSQQQQFILSGSHDKCCIIWSATRHNVGSSQFDFSTKFTLSKHTDFISAAHSVMFGTSILTVTASLDYTINIWIDDTCKANAKINYYVYDARISALWCHELKKDIILLFLGASDDKVHVYRIDFDRADHILTEAAQIVGHSDWIRSVDTLLSADRSTMLLASASQDKFARVWRISLSYTSYDSLLVKSSLLPDTTTDGGPIYLSILLETVLAGHESRINSVRWNKSTKKLANSSRSDAIQLMTCSADKSIIIWESHIVVYSEQMDVEGMDPDKPPSGYERNLTNEVWQERLRLGEIGENNLGLLGASLSPDSDCIFAYSLNGALHSWRRKGSPSDEGEYWEPEAVINGHFGPVTDICWQRNGAYFITSSLDKTCRLHAKVPNANHWCEVARPQVHGYEINCVSLINSLRFISGSDEKNLRVFDSTKFFVKSFYNVTGIDLMASSDALLFSSIKSSLAEQAQAPALGLSNRGITSNNVSKSGDAQIVESSQDHPPYATENVPLPVEEFLLQSTLWPEVQKLYGHSYEIYTVDCDRAGIHIASASRANKAEFACVIIWCAKTFDQIASLENHTLTVTRVKFSPNDKYILSVSRDRTWCIRENSKETRFAKLASTSKNNAVHSRIIWDCSWTPDSQCFVTVSRERRAIAWSLAKVLAGSNSEAFTVDVSSCLSLESPMQAVDIINDLKKQNDWLVAIGQENGDITLTRLSYLNDVFKWNIVYTINQCHSLSIKRLSFQPQTSDSIVSKVTLASAGEDHLVQLTALINLS